MIHFKNMVYFWEDSFLIIEFKLIDCFSTYGTFLGSALTFGMKLIITLRWYTFEEGCLLWNGVLKQRFLSFLRIIYWIGEYFNGKSCVRSFETKIFEQVVLPSAYILFVSLLVLRLFLVWNWWSRIDRKCFGVAFLLGKGKTRKRGCCNVGVAIILWIINSGKSGHDRYHSNAASFQLKANIN